MKKSIKKATKKTEASLDSNSTENQRIKGKFVEREVKALFSYEMDALLKVNGSGEISKELPTFDNIENLYEYKCPDCGEVVKPSKITPGAYSCTGYKCEYTAPDTHFCEQEPQEILEWWIVTEYLYDKLKEKGEPVLEWGNNYYWGRTCSGQAILLDGVISEICREMEILDGQKYSWAQK